MGTLLQVRISADSRTAALAASDRVLTAVANAESRLSTWRVDSQLALVMAAAPGEDVAISADLADDLDAALRCHELTGGAFDPSVGPLVTAWGLRRGGARPEAAELQAALAAVGLDGLRWTASSARRLRPDLQLDAGGFAKGAGLDDALEVLAADARVDHAVLDFGGQLAVYRRGTDEESAERKAVIRIAHPDDRQRAMAEFSITAGSVATTGNGERGIVIGGEMLGHVLDPRTGRPAYDFGSLTVWTGPAHDASATLADCLATGLYVLGPDAALDFAARQDGVEVLVARRTPSGIEVRASSGITDLRTRSEPDRVEQLEKEIVQIRAEMAALRAELSARKVTEEAEEQPSGPVSDTPADTFASDFDGRLGTIERQIETLAQELERQRLGESVFRKVEESEYGMGVAASKVYQVESGLSIGGYGEAIYQGFDSTLDDGTPSGKRDQADFLRAIVYFGYKFDDRWIFNSEIEFEHASTSQSGSASVEFAYLDYLFRPAANLRFGLLLVPMGFINELHEPPLFLGARRPDIENRIIPTTWRENGFGLFGDVGPFTYRTYVINGLEGGNFSSSGLRGGRQKGSKALAESIAWVGRLDYTARPGLLAGVSAYVGDSGQGLTDASGREIGLGTTILEARVDYEIRGFQFRALAVQAQVDDVARLNETLGLTGAASVGETLDGFYVQLGYDLLARHGGERALIPYARWESHDSQSEVPAGFARNPARDVESLTLGFSYQPIDPLVFKIDYQDYDNGAGTGLDQINVALGYIF